jgi:phage-related protein
MSLSEAWESDEFKPFAESSPKKQIITNNRLNPTTPKIPIDLIEEAKHSDKAQHELVEKWLGK